MGYVIKIVPRENGELIESKAEALELDELQDLVEGYIETVPAFVDEIEEPIVMIVNEEGKLKGLAVNECETDIMRYNICDVIVGNAVLVIQSGAELLPMDKATAEKILQQLQKY